MNTNDELVGALMNAPVVSVAIGLMFAYLIASLVASSIKEVIASVFQWRGTYLQKGIGVLLSNTPNAAFAWGSIGKWLAAHVTWMDPTGTPAAAVTAAEAAANAAAKAIAATKAAIAATAAAAAAPGPDTAAAANNATLAATEAGTAATNAAATANAAAGAKAATPGAAALAQAAAAAATKAAAAVTSQVGAVVTDAEAALATATAALNVHGVQTHPLLKGTPTKLPSYVPARDFGTALLDMLRDGSANPAFSQVERTVAALPDGDIKRILSAFIQDAAGDLDQLRARIETWFDDSMDRLSGIYKRFAQYFLLALGLLIAVVLNVDSVHMAIALWNQPALRAEIVAQVQAAIPASNPGGTSGANNTPGTPSAASSGGAAPNTLNVNPTDNLTVRQAAQQLNSLPLPIGRPSCASLFGEPMMPADKSIASPSTATTGATSVPANGTAPAAPASPAAGTQAAPSAATPAAAASAQPGACPTRTDYASGWSAWNWWAMLGWLITAFAISLGAPFWFGLLQNVMNLRSAGPPPNRADGTPAANT